MFHELVSRDHEDERVTGEPQGIGSEAYLNGTSQEPTPEDARLPARRAYSSERKTVISRVAAGNSWNIRVKIFKRGKTNGAWPVARPGQGNKTAQYSHLTTSESGIVKINKVNIIIARLSEQVPLPRMLARLFLFRILSNTNHHWTLSLPGYHR